MKQEETKETGLKPRNPTVSPNQEMAPDIPRRELHPTWMGEGKKQDGGQTEEHKDQEMKNHQEGSWVTSVPKGTQNPNFQRQGGWQGDHPEWDRYIR